MWTLTGPFDGEVVGELGFQKTKLLKTGMTYPLGRKGTGLVISNKKISSHHCEFVVGPYSVNDVSDPGKKPILEFINKKDKGMRISRGGVEYPVNPSTTRDLEDGDIVAIISGVLITVQWTPVCCYTQALRGKSTVPLDSCASLGINVVLTPSPHVTHHLTPNYAANPVMAASLLSACQFVKPEWITEVIRLGNLPRNNDPSDGVPLEQTFALPLASKYRPIFSPSLQPPQKAFNVWEPNEERLNMFSKYRFLWVDEKARELDGNYKDVIERGGGSFEMFDVHGGTAKLHRALTRGQAKEGKKQLVVGKENSIQAAIGKDGWKELVNEAKTFGLHFIEPDSIIQVVVDVDPSLFDVPPSGTNMEVDEVRGISSPLPSFVPNTHPDEPSVPPPQPEQKSGPSRKLTRRVTSRQASQELVSASKSPEPSVEVEPPRPRRALTRRVNAGIPVITGLDDPSSILDSVPDLSAPRSTSVPPPPVLDLTAPTPMRSTKLKRRLVGGMASDSLDPGIFALSIDEPVKEPPLKKFKALFDASHPDRTGAGSFDDAALEEVQSATLGASTDTQTQSQTQEGRGRSSRSAAVTNLSILREEEEETPSATVGHTMERGTKRAIVDVNHDAEVERGGDHGELTGAKKRAIENVNAVEKVGNKITKPVSMVGSKPPSTALTSKPTKPGALPGQPDKDTSFLKAIASTKRGKKMEDEFDRDFNKLKISKPDLVREEPEKEWAILEDFGDETNIRGNFMVVVEMDVPNNESRRRRSFNEVSEWQGKPNFKKFKKKGITVRKAAIELVISEENDYGMGPAYWKGGNSQPTQTENTTQRRNGALTEEPAPTFPRGKSQAMIINDSDEEVVAVPRGGKSKASSRAGSAAPSKRTSSRNTKSTKQPLFLDSDDEVGIPEDEGEVAASDDDVLTLRSSAGTNTRPKRTTRAPVRGTKKPAPILVDDDSDDGAVFKGFTGKTRRTR